MIIAFVVTILVGYIGMHVDLFWNANGFGPIFAIASMGIFILAEIKKSKDK